MRLRCWTTDLRKEWDKKDNNVVDIEYAANITVKLRNTAVTWVENNGNERVDESHKVLLDKNGNHSFYVDGGAVTMNRIKRIVYNKG